MHIKVGQRVRFTKDCTHIIDAQGPNPISVTVLCGTVGTVTKFDSVDVDDIHVRIEDTTQLINHNHTLYMSEDDGCEYPCVYEYLEEILPKLKHERAIETFLTVLLQDNPIEAKLDKDTYRQFQEALNGIANKYVELNLEAAKEETKEEA